MAEGMAAGERVSNYLQRLARAGPNTSTWSRTGDGWMTRATEISVASAKRLKALLLGRSTVCIDTGSSTVS